jgi:glyoxylase-like metal-dependent hydrolase (beta-lactamase superfamily II)
MMASLKRLAQLEGDYRVFPGHEQSTTLEQERKTNPYMLEALRT